MTDRDGESLHSRLMAFKSEMFVDDVTFIMNGICHSGLGVTKDAIGSLIQKEAENARLNKRVAELEDVIRDDIVQCACGDFGLKLNDPESECRRCEPRFLALNTKDG